VNSRRLRRSNDDDALPALPDSCAGACCGHGSRRRSHAVGDLPAGPAGSGGPGSRGGRCAAGGPAGELAAKPCGAGPPGGAAPARGAGLPRGPSRPTVEPTGPAEPAVQPSRPTSPALTPHAAPVAEAPSIGGAAALRLLHPRRFLHLLLRECAARRKRSAEPTLVCSGLAPRGPPVVGRRRCVVGHRRASLQARRLGWRLPSRQTAGASPATRELRSPMQAGSLISRPCRLLEGAGAAFAFRFGVTEAGKAG
jgi:hypothetical protein